MRTTRSKLFYFYNSFFDFSWVYLSLAYCIRFINLVKTSKVLNLWITPKQVNLAIFLNIKYSQLREYYNVRILAKNMAFHKFLISN